MFQTFLHVRCIRTHYHYWERTGSVCILHLYSVFARPPIRDTSFGDMLTVRAGCLLVLNSVASAPQWGYASLAEQFKRRMRVPILGTVFAELSRK
jgi:hypothetical protein